MKTLALILAVIAVLFGLSGCIFVAGEQPGFHHNRVAHAPVWAGPHGPGGPGPHRR